MISGIDIAAGPGRGGVRATRAGDGPNLPRKTWACASNTFDELAAIQPDFEQNRGAGILRAVIWSSGTRNNQGWFFRSHHPALAGQMHCAGHGTVHATGTGAQLRGGTGVILGQMKALDQGFKFHAFSQ